VIELVTAAELLTVARREFGEVGGELRSVVLISWASTACCNPCHARLAEVFEQRFTCVGFELIGFGRSLGHAGVLMAFLLWRLLGTVEKAGPPSRKDALTARDAGRILPRLESERSSSLAAFRSGGSYGH